MRETLEAFQSAIDNFLQPVKAFLEDESVSEILINGHEEIFVEIGGKLQKTSARFNSEDDLRAAVNNIAQSVGRRITEKEPRLDARLPDGSRIHAVIPPVTKGTSVAIRKFKKTNVNFKQYIQWGAISVEGAQFLDACMYLGKNILVSGGTGSGKTTLLGLLCSRIPKQQRVIVIEDSAELDIDYEHVLYMETQMADIMGEGEVNMQDLLKSSLRMRPDRIIVGEVRGSEAMELVNAMNTGHKGCLGTVHANAPADAMVRLEVLAMSGETKVSQKAVQYQIGTAVDLVIQISRLSDGSRRVTEIAEVCGLDAAGYYRIEPIYDLRNLQRGADGKMVGSLEPTGYTPSFMPEIQANKIPIPVTRFQKKADVA
jgi:pilus assembly protein CpaF